MKYIGKYVTITNKDSMYCGEWGRIVHYDGEYYHVAIANDSKNSVIFDRDEFKISRSSWFD